MNRLISFLLGGLFSALVLMGYQTAIAAPDLLPAPRVEQVQIDRTPTPEPTAVPTPQTFVKADNPQTAVGMFGLAGQVQCWNCAPFSQFVHVSHYDPMASKYNCWDYDEKQHYCYSPTTPGIKWKGLWGFGAACPESWPFGTWVVIPRVGSFVCLDHGNEITCNTTTAVCNVDILGPTGPWDGQIIESTLWVPLDPPRGE